METTFTKLNFPETLKDSFAIGIKNAPSILAVVLLWLVTIWIPYINLGTTIALSLLPMEMAKGNVINPLGIFDAKYRRYMGEYLIASGLMFTAIFVAMFFMVVPAMVLSIAWSLTYYFMFEKGKNPIQAIKASNDATYGSKWAMFGVSLVVGLFIVIIYAILGAIFGTTGTVGPIFVMLVVIVLAMPVSLAISASFWKQLKNNVE